MKRDNFRPYLYGMFAGFGAIGLSVAFFFVLYRLQGVEEALGTVMDILMPFIYGSVIAYLLRPMCNAYSNGLRQLFKGKRDGLAETLAITGSVITGALIVYMLIIMIAPQLYQSAANFWDTVPAKTEALVVWATEKFGENEVMLRYFDITLNIPDFVWVVFLAVIFGGVLTMILSKWIFHPITRLGRAMRQGAKGDFSVRLKDKHRLREIEEIYRNFNLMTQELGATEI